MLATDAKTQKIEPDPNFFMMDENFGLSVQFTLRLLVHTDNTNTKGRMWIYTNKHRLKYNIIYNYTLKNKGA